MSLFLHNLPLAWTPGPLEISLIAIAGLVLFGKRLPEVGRSLGKSIVEFKKGIKGIEEDVDAQATASKPAALPKEDEPAKQLQSEPQSTERTTA